MKTGIYMVIKTGNILLFFACDWSKEFSFIIAKTRGKVRGTKIPKADSHGPDLVYIGEYF